MNDEIAVLKLVAGRLDAAGIAYMVTGPLALSRYVEPRMTRDIDLVVALEPADASKLADSLGDEFDCDVETIRNAIAGRGFFNMIHIGRIVKVDFMVRKSTPFRLEEFSRRRPVDVDGQQIWIVSPEDLLLSKLAWARESRSSVQLADAARLVDSAAIDQAYVERWATDLGVSDLLNEVRR